jgi:hypothetical protein
LGAQNECAGNDLALVQIVGYPPSALADLDRYEAIVKLLEAGANREPFRSKTLPPLENRVGRKDKLIALSRERFAAPRAVVERKVNRWMQNERGRFQVK